MKNSVKCLLNRLVKLEKDVEEIHGFKICRKHKTLTLYHTVQTIWHRIKVLQKFYGIATCLQSSKSVRPKYTLAHHVKSQYTALLLLETAAAFPQLWTKIQTKLGDSKSVVLSDEIDIWNNTYPGKQIKDKTNLVLVGDPDKIIATIKSNNSFNGSNLTIKISNIDNYEGLFKFINTSENNIGTVANLNVGFDKSSMADNAGGIICGQNSYFSVFNCSFSGDIKGSGAGGICGYLSKNSTIKNCYSTGYIGNGRGGAAGICGDTLSNSIVENCYSSGDIGSNSSSISDWGYGICLDSSNTTIKSCYSTGQIGVGSAGICSGNLKCNIINCYSTGAIGEGGTGGAIGEGGTGGITPSNTGQFGNVIIKNCYSTGTIGKTGGAGGICGFGTYNTCTVINCYSHRINDNQQGGTGNGTNAMDGNYDVTNLITVPTFEINLVTIDSSKITIDYFLDWDPSVWKDCINGINCCSINDTIDCSYNSSTGARRDAKTKADYTLADGIWKPGLILDAFTKLPWNGVDYTRNIDTPIFCIKCCSSESDCTSAKANQNQIIAKSYPECESAKGFWKPGNCKCVKCCSGNDCSWSGALNHMHNNKQTPLNNIDSEINCINSGGTWKPYNCL